MKNFSEQIGNSPPLLNEQSHFDNVVSAGGGVKVWALLGVRAALDEFKFPLNNVKRCAGTSAGSPAGVAPEESAGAILVNSICPCHSSLAIR